MQRRLLSGCARHFGATNAAGGISIQGTAREVSNSFCASRVLGEPSNCPGRAVKRLIS